MGVCMVLIFLFALFSKGGFGDAVGVSNFNDGDPQSSIGLEMTDVSYLLNQTLITSTRRPDVNPTTSSILKSHTASSIHMCENSEMLNTADKVDLIAIGTTIANMSKSCSCSINTTSKANTISIKISHENRGRACLQKPYDYATLDVSSLGGRHLINFQKDNLSDYSSYFFRVSVIRFDITLHSSCGSNYTIQLKESTPVITTAFSQVQCRYTEVINTPLSSGISTVAVTAGGDFLTESESTNLPRKAYSQSSVQSTPVTLPVSNTGLIVGIVVGVGVGLILISIIVFCGYRAKHQRKTNPNKNLPTRKSNDLDPEKASSSETFECRRINNSTQAHSGTRIDYQHVEINPLALKTEENFYDVCGIDDNAFHHSNTLLDSRPITSDDDYEAINPRPSSSIDNDTTLIENDLYA